MLTTLRKLSPRTQPIPQWSAALATKMGKEVTRLFGGSSLRSIAAFTFSQDASRPCESQLRVISSAARVRSCLSR
jgi:hypothetical protein